MASTTGAKEEVAAAGTPRRVPPGTLLYLREGVRSGVVVQEICLLRVLK
jgi:hypothetical protein